jgi:crotonobetainyl-CoA:carnitine CoA-transferase CaiB-like acyl-CoA transferase
MAHLPLAGLRVLDMTVVWSGPTVTMGLSDLGAEVVRVDNPWLFPSSTRGMVPRPTPPQMAMMGTMGSAYPDLETGEFPWDRHAMFNWHARGKKMMTLDLRQESGHEIFLKLVAKADIFVENNNVSVLDHLGINFDVLHKVNPRLILLRMPPAGVGAPYSTYLGFGAHFEAFSGITAVRGYADSAPATTTSVFQMDPAAGSVGVFAVLAAVRRREKTGEGEQIVLPQVENEMNHIGEMFIDAASTGNPSAPMTNRDRNFVQGVYPSNEDDRFVSITIRTDAEWASAVGVMGNPAWAADPRFATQEGRLAAQDDIDAGIAEWTRQRTRNETFHAMQAVGVPAGPLMLEDDIYADPHVKARGFFRENTAVHAGTHVYPNHQWKWDGPAMKWEPISGLGQDNDYIYKDVLGFSDEEYAKAQSEGHIASAYLKPDGTSV